MEKRETVMVADVLHAFSSSSSFGGECDRDVTVTSGNPLPPITVRTAPFPRVHPAMGDPFDVIPFDVRPIYSAG